MENQTMLKILILSGLSDIPNIQTPLFLFFLLIYLTTLTGNFLIIFLIFADSHLHTPMYFFLGSLACLDVSYSSVTAPRMLSDIHREKRVISLQACITQLFFFIFFAVSEMFLLAVMSYDRFIAICHPLQYLQIMHGKVCAQMVSTVLALGLANSLIQTLCLLRLNFCHLDTLKSFFCDLPQLLQVSCTDPLINILLILIPGILLGGGVVGLTFYPYINIMATVWKIPSINVRSKTFSTCGAHLTVVFIFYGTLFFNYFHPNSSHYFTMDRLVSVFYAVLTPLLNPIIYSLRNQELKSALKRTLSRL
ncbi:hypothetical protein XELAEV_18045722mg [Xenopus laevis]|uniref:Olfactory receptor n=1 Tax=Xenopus laevis TaxID=8355 RepID=A0A974H4I5_XENLA|nr:hypothetical protein XELAEV_18045722mg [Xenopus laevis]